MTQRLRVAAGAAIAIGVMVLSLTACAAPPAASPQPEARASDDASTPSADAGDAVEASTPAVTDAAHTDSPCPPIVPLDNSVVDRLMGYNIPIPQDGGAQQYATGTVTLDSAGVPVAYRVAEGDTMTGISERFCVWDLAIMNMNSVRRGFTPELFVGDTINLDAYAVTSVGDINGAVLDLEPWAYIPPQREL